MKGYTSTTFRSEVNFISQIGGGRDAKGVKMKDLWESYAFPVYFDLKEYERELKMGELHIKYLLYTNDQVILVPSTREL
ncbi:hypothetical protein EVAR_29411_1 [Eumeta japonica]|uniref:Uncharacterized protein n=1 Tax=Eumeta variegata TaxID=151549 RepID=A0A4C1VSD1_EUMVA|nr:hypothetical protein EVAR_29411_1 [Eumeta japonica]